MFGIRSTRGKCFVISLMIILYSVVRYSVMETYSSSVTRGSRDEHSIKGEEQDLDYQVFVYSLDTLVPLVKSFFRKLKQI